MEVVAGNLHKVRVNETQEMWFYWQVWSILVAVCSAQKRFSIPAFGMFSFFLAGYFSPDHVAAALWPEDAGQAWDYSPLSSYISVTACNYASSTEPLFNRLLVHTWERNLKLSNVVVILKVQNYRIHLVSMNPETKFSFMFSWEKGHKTKMIVDCGHLKWTMMPYSFSSRVVACLPQTYIGFMAKQTKHPSPKTFEEAANYDP